MPAVAGPPIAQENGILVDELCRTSAADVYAAGDVANHLHPLFGRVRVEHYNNAEKQGTAAAKSMLGSAAPYGYIHSFWSDQYEHKLEYVGHAASWDDFVIRGSLEEAKLVGFYLLDGRVLAAVGLDRGGDPELDRDSEMAACARLVAERARPDRGLLADARRGSVVASALTGRVRRGQPAGSARSGVGEQGDVRPAGRGQRAVQQGDDEFRDITGCQAGAKLGVGLTQHLGVNRARAHADGADAVLLAFHRDRLGEADDPVLGDVVRGQPGELLGGVDAGQRGDVDDPPFPGGAAWR